MPQPVPADLLEIAEALVPGAPLGSARLAEQGNMHLVVLFPGVAAVRISKRPSHAAELPRRVEILQVVAAAGLPFTVPEPLTAVATLGDLGGLPSQCGPRIARGAVVRGDAPRRLTDEGWAAPWAHGVRTVVDLRHESDQGPDVAARPCGLTTLRLPLDDPADTEFWSRSGGDLDCTPLYYRATATLIGLLG